MLKEREAYQEYTPGKSFDEAFQTDRIPMLMMEQLRSLDFPISRHISYERTVDEFLLQLVVNDALRALKVRRDLVVLLNEEGALILDGGTWILLFTPQYGEQATLPEDVELYPVFANLLEKEEKGEVCRIEVPKRSMRTLINQSSPFCILDEYCRKEPGGYLAIAERIVFAGPEELYAHVPVCHFKSLVTADVDEIESYQTIKSLLDDYIEQCDQAEEGENVQPLSVAVFGAPGAGKSFGVKQIAATSGRFSVTSLNVSQYSGPSDLFEALDEALSSSGEGIPLIFFDEFDSENDGKSRGWLRYFLAPMQDGEFAVRGKIEEIRRAVFVFAGGTAASFMQFLPDTEEETEQFRAVKGPDFVSRLKGVLNIKGLNPSSVRDRSHIIRRAMLLREQIIRRVPGIYNEEGKLINISKGLLSALLRVSEYRHGARSLEFILAMCRLSDVNRFTPSCLPMDEQLDIHLDVKDFRNKLTFEQVMGEAVDLYARIAHEKYRKRRIDQWKAEVDLTGIESAIPLSEPGEAASSLEIPKGLLSDPEMASWEDLDERYKENSRSQIRYLGENLVSYESEIGLRPVVPGARDAIDDLYGPALEQIAEMEHERWMLDRRKNGWTYGKDDPELMQASEMVPYEELEEKSKDYIRKAVRQIPEQLREIGYELYHKSF